MVPTKAQEGSRQAPTTLASRPAQAPQQRPPQATMRGVLSLRSSASTLLNHRNGFNRSLSSIESSSRRSPRFRAGDPATEERERTPDSALPLPAPAPIGGAGSVSRLPRCASRRALPQLCSAGLAALRRPSITRRSALRRLCGGSRRAFTADTHAPPTYAGKGIYSAQHRAAQPRTHELAQEYSATR
jgi:hypothetical protein